MTTPDISLAGLALSYLLLIPGFALLLWYGVPLFRDGIIAVIRMTVQLLFVGLYLQVVFVLDNPLLTLAWLVMMVLVADATVVRRAGLNWRRFLLPLAAALLLGTVPPLLFFLALTSGTAHPFDPRLVIPITGMILGNCLRADVIGMRMFHQSVSKRQSLFQHRLAAGASLPEACRPFIRDAFDAALAPTIATIATFGLVTLPGMMTGVILGGADPMTAVKYQIAIAIAILSGTVITIWAGIALAMRVVFDEYGMLREGTFRGGE